MTTRDDFDRSASGFDRLMTAWFDAEAHVPEPEDLFERTVVRTARVRPRPAWLLPERWLPMELTMRPVHPQRAATYLILVALLVVLAVGAILTVAARRHVPAPFGPAFNGRVAIVQNGDIATIDPATNDIRTIVTGPEVDRFPVFSRDGTRIAFIRFNGGGDQVVAVDADGSHPVTLNTTPVSHIVGFTWSPEGSQIAFESAHSLWVVRTDGSDARKIELANGLLLDAELAWRPPDGKELVFRGLGAGGNAGLYTVKLDGSDLRSLTPSDGAEFDYVWMTLSPDGRRVAYHRMSKTQVEVLAIGEAKPTVLEPTNGIGMTFPRFSPDGTKLAVMTWPKDGGNQIGVVSADDPTPDVTLTGPTLYGGIQFDWSPDGTQILAAAWNSTVPWILDPAGGPGEQTAWLAAFPDWVEWQRLAERP